MADLADVLWNLFRCLSSSVSQVFQNGGAAASDVWEAIMSIYRETTGRA